MTDKTINGKYDELKQQEEWLKERREYTRCKYNQVCTLYRETAELCLDHSEDCPIKRNLDLLLKQQSQAVAEGQRRLNIRR